MSLISNYIKQIRKCKDNLFDIESRISTQVKMNYLCNLALNCVDNGITDKEYQKDTPIIVSLTTYGQRLQEVYYSLESLLHQTLQPNKIVLCISEDFKSENNLPLLLKKQLNRGVEILYCKDLGPYTKLIPTLKQYPSAIIITVDDDMLYPIDFIEYLVKSYKKRPNDIHCYYGHTMILDKKGKMESYDKWVKQPASGISILNFPTGVDGVLYPPNCFHEDIIREDIFLKLCPHADDVWFKAMTLLKNKDCVVVPRMRKPRQEFLCINPTGTETLANLNRVKKLNDIQIKNVFDYYNLYKIIH